MAKSLKGYQSFEIGAIASDGDMGTVLAALGTTVKGSVSVTSTDAQVKEFNIEESTQPFDTAVTEDPKMEGTLEIYDVTPAIAVKVFGGTATSTGTGAAMVTTYTPPALYTPLEVSARLTSKNNVKLNMPRVQLLPKWELFFKDEELGKIVLKFKVLQPTKTNVAPYTMAVPTPA